MCITTVSNTDTQIIIENVANLSVIAEKIVGQYNIDIECANNVLESLQDEMELTSSNQYLLAEAKMWIEKLEQQKNQLINHLSSAAENFETFEQVA